MHLQDCCIQHEKQNVSTMSVVNQEDEMMHTALREIFTEGFSSTRIESKNGEGQRRLEDTFSSRMSFTSIRNETANKMALSSQGMRQIPGTRSDHAQFLCSLLGLRRLGTSLGL